MIFPGIVALARVPKMFTGDNFLFLVFVAISLSCESMFSCFGLIQKLFLWLEWFIMEMTYGIIQIDQVNGCSWLNTIIVDVEFLIMDLVAICLSQY